MPEFRSFEENGTRRFRLFQTKFNNVKFRCLIPALKAQNSNDCLENREENERPGSTCSHGACPLHQLTNFTCERIVSQYRQPASFFFKKLKIFFSRVFAAVTAI